MYGVSKLAVNAYCKALAKELEAKHIMVNTCCPGEALSFVLNSYGHSNRQLSSASWSTHAVHVRRRPLPK